MTGDKNLGIFLDLQLVFLIISGKYNNFACSAQIFKLQKCHDLICLSIFDLLIRDHPTDCHDLSVGQGIIVCRTVWRSIFRHVFFTVFFQYEICCHRGYVFCEELLVILQRMSADIYAKYFFFK